MGYEAAGLNRHRLWAMEASEAIAIGYDAAGMAFGAA
jgi:hypothetical protein